MSKNNRNPTISLQSDPDIEEALITDSAAIAIRQSSVPESGQTDIHHTG